MAHSNSKNTESSHSRVYSSADFSSADFSSDTQIDSKNNYNELKLEFNKVKQAFDFANFAIVSFDIKGRVLTFNKTFRELFELSSFVAAQDITPEFIKRWLNDNTRNAKAILSGGYQSLKKFKEPIVTIFELNDGRFIRGTSRGVVENDLVTAIVWSLVDITELKTNERIARHHANHDSLTRLPNRYRLFEKLESDIASAKLKGEGLALLFMDVDHFKEINDSYGHHVGDQFLVEVANRITASLRVPDTLARIGGDEFVVILNKISNRELIISITERIKSAFVSPFVINDIKIKSSISVGIAIYPNDTTSGRTLMKQADTAMYQVKNSGRDSYCFFDTIEQ